MMKNTRYVSLNLKFAFEYDFLLSKNKKKYICNVFTLSSKEKLKNYLVFELLVEILIGWELFIN